MQACARKEGVRGWVLLDFSRSDLGRKTHPLPLPFHCRSQLDQAEQSEGKFWGGHAFCSRTGWNPRPLLSITAHMARGEGRGISRRKVLVGGGVGLGLLLAWELWPRT